MPDSDVDEDARQAHFVVINRTHQGYGFNIRGQVAAGGVLRPINGELYMPMQYVSALVEDGPGVAGGLRLGDRVLEVNGTSSEGLSHNEVVDLIRRSGELLKLSVISVTKDEAKHLEMDARPVQPSVPDVFERSSIPISIPSFSEEITDAGEAFVQYNLHLSGKQTCSRRYREFDALSKSLKRQYADITFPKLPPKWPFKLSVQKLEQRRRSLEEWLDTVCSVRFLSENSEVQEFIGAPKI
ncbi:sorting nexin-27-like [Sycon ciliatum]|uniref:sorting nexin-27-like n=1 Tax=Sycon ciliatum TaxID=27933 RepID=UPI0020AD6FD8|eukprot:scpid24658/ scgid32589/ Sorting nexin-27